MANIATDFNNRGFFLGGNLGKSTSKNPLTWQIDIHYQILPADALFAAFTESDFNGGGTDNKGWKISGKMTLIKGVQLAVQTFLENTNVDGDSESKNSIYQFDTKWYF